MVAKIIACRITGLIQVEYKIKRCKDGMGHRGRPEHNVFPGGPQLKSTGSHRRSAGKPAGAAVFKHSQRGERGSIGELTGFLTDAGRRITEGGGASIGDDELTGFLTDASRRITEG